MNSHDRIERHQFLSEAEQTKLLLSQRETAFLSRHGYHFFKRARELRWCAHLLNRKRCPNDLQPVSDCLLPRVLNDHVHVYADRLGYPVLTCQPYTEPVELNEIAKLAIAFSTRWKLYFRMSNEEGWYAPDRPVIIEFWGAEPLDAVHLARSGSAQ